MKKVFVLLLVVIACLSLKAQEKSADSHICYPYMFSKDYAVVSISAKTTDEELFNIRRNILKYSSIRFTNFDVIRGKDGDIYFLSMAVDCRDGFKGDISHSFEPGDTTHYGFIRDYTKDPNKIAFYIGNLDAENSCISHVEERVAKTREEANNLEQEN